MEITQRYNIKLKQSNEQGMFNTNILMNFLYKVIKSICEINVSTGDCSGFFCKIPYTENNNLLLPVLITNNHIFSTNYPFIEKKYIKIIIDGKFKTLSLKNRKGWINKEMGFMCIEIREKEDDIHNFLNLDDIVLENNFSNDCYLNKKVLIFDIKVTKKASFSNGFIKNCKDCFFEYTCDTFKRISGGPIVNETNNCVIGIDKGEIVNEDKKVVNQGIFIKNVIKIIKKNENKVNLKLLLIFFYSL